MKNKNNYIEVPFLETKKLSLNYDSAINYLDNTLNGLTTINAELCTIDDLSIERFGCVDFPKDRTISKDGIFTGSLLNQDSNIFGLKNILTAQPINSSLTATAEITENNNTLNGLTTINAELCTIDNVFNNQNDTLKTSFLDSNSALPFPTKINCDEILYDNQEKSLLIKESGIYKEMPQEKILEIAECFLEASEKLIERTITRIIEKKPSIINKITSLITIQNAAKVQHPQNNNQKILKRGGTALNNIMISTIKELKNDGLNYSANDVWKEFFSDKEKYSHVIKCMNRKEITWTCSTTLKEKTKTRLQFNKDISRFINQGFID
jgi:hypothetical protein